jgi:NTP pyrophosphatase (non-canonical NTP hydrolase)
MDIPMRENLVYAVNCWGVGAQKNKVVEELLELAVELSRDKPDFDAVRSEIADVLIVIEYLYLIMPISKRQVKDVLAQKMERLDYRIKKEYADREDDIQNEEKIRTDCIPEVIDTIKKYLESEGQQHAK